MSQDEIQAQAEDLINKMEQENKEKEENKIDKKSTQNNLTYNEDEEPNEEKNEQLLSKQNMVINKNYKRSDSISSSDSDSSPHDGSDDEELKKRKKNIKINPKFKTSMASNDSNLENLMVSEDLTVKISTLISCVICIVTIGFNIVFSLIDNKLTLTFGYTKNKDAQELADIVMNHTMIYALLIVLIGFNLGLFIVVLLGNDNMLNKLIYTDLNWYFVLTQFALGFQFLITLIWDIDLWTINVCLSVSMLAILILAFYFTEIKGKKNMSKCTFIFIYVYVSILFSFIAYITLFNISCILMENVGNDDEETRTTLIRVIKIVINACQTLLSTVLLSFYKDIFFSLCSAYIESAVFIHLDTKFEGENIALLIFALVIVCFVIITLLAYKKKTFGCEEVSVIENFN